jgi:hypothetical protein
MPYVIVSMLLHDPFTSHEETTCLILSITQEWIIWFVCDTNIIVMHKETGRHIQR